MGVIINAQFMNSDDLKDHAREGLKYLLFKSKNFKEALKELRDKHEIDVKRGNEPFMGDKQRISDETPQVQRRIKVHVKVYLKNNRVNDLKPLVDDVKAFQEGFFLKRCPFHEIISLVVLGSFPIEPSSYRMQMNLDNITLDLVIKPHISKKEFNSIWKEVKKLREIAKIMKSKTTPKGRGWGRAPRRGLGTIA